MPSKEIFSEEPEPHLARRKAILEEFPNIRNLFIIDKNLKYVTTFLVIVQLTIPFLLPQNIWIHLLVMYFVGATIAHALFLAIHEITHDVAFKKTSWNNWLAMFANFPLVFPMAMAFKIYHAKHHWQQGSIGQDVDLPSKLERIIFRGYLGKVLWMINQIIFYAIRPLVILPLKLDKWNIANFIIQLAFIIGYFYLTSWFGIIYLFGSLYIAGGLHPTSGHFVAEHYIVKENQETYSYYGWLNKLTFNVGYHNEHHDFPNIPGSQLPKVREMAGKYYNDLYIQKSWILAKWKFLTNPALSLYSRVRRK